MEFRDWREASVQGGQLAAAALLEQFGLKERVEREPALDRRRHRGKGYTPLVYVTQLLLIPVELKRHARQLKACLYAPAGWVTWWRGLLEELLPRCRVLGGVGAGGTG